MERPGSTEGWDDADEGAPAGSSVGDPSFERVSGAATGRAKADVQEPIRDPLLLLAQSEERYRYTIALSPLIAWTADAIGGLLEVDERGLELAGLSFDQLRGGSFLAVVHPDDRAQVIARWRQNATLGQPIDNDVRIRLCDGRYRWHRSRAAPRRDDAGRILRWYGTIEDIHDRKLAEAAIRWAAEHDGLTGVSNRAAFYVGLRDAIAAAAQQQSEVALLLFDLDNFKQINDQFGHDVGDAVLRDVAARLSSATDAPMMVGRVGGDRDGDPEPQCRACSADHIRAQRRGRDDRAR